MVLANVDGIGALEMVGLLVDFLIESRGGLVSLCPRRKVSAMDGTVNILGPSSQLNAVLTFVLVCVSRWH